jgi:pimeloyl-[acyl-carrier protein] methyl ester esterase
VVAAALRVDPAEAGRILSAARGAGGALEAERAAADRARVQFRILSDADYPELLRASPDPPELLPQGPASQPVGPEGRRRLRDDLERLAACADLPPGFPEGVPVLIVEAGADRIVGPEARALLRERLPHAEVLHFEGAGHCLLQAPLPEELRRWITGTLGP